MWFNKKKKLNSEVSKFSILSYTQNRKLENLGKFFCTYIFCSIWNSKSNKWLKNDQKQKKLTLWCGLRRKMSISEVSKFSILPYTQNRKLGISESFLLLKFLVVYETQNRKTDWKMT